MEAHMDRRQKKTREAILGAFAELVSKKHYSKISVGEIIDKANVGRATFYAHFETKDFLLKELCRELFCHIFDSSEHISEHHHIFECDAPSSVALRLLGHFEKNDNNILDLLACENNELFLRYFKEEMSRLIERSPHLFESQIAADLPLEYWKNHVSSSFVETVRWWVGGKMTESAETVCSYFLSVI